MDKICYKCLIAKSTINFSKIKISKDSFNIYCKSCCKLLKNPIQDNQYAKIYRDEKKDILQTKYTCDCGGKYSFLHKTTHIKTKKHQAYINSQVIEV
jgi:hypothetical protein